MSENVNVFTGKLGEGPGQSHVARADGSVFVKTDNVFHAHRIAACMNACSGVDHRVLVTVSVKELLEIAEQYRQLKDSIKFIAEKLQ